DSPQPARADGMRESGPKRGTKTGQGNKGKKCGDIDVTETERRHARALAQTIENEADCARSGDQHPNGRGCSHCCKRRNRAEHEYWNDKGSATNPDKGRKTADPRRCYGSYHAFW